MVRKNLSTHCMIERILYINGKLETGLCPNAYKLAEELECSVQTIYRDLAFYKERLMAPIVYDTYRRGYYFAEPYSLAANL